MKYYIKIENDKIVSGPKLLPVCDKNTSGLNLLDDNALKEKGYHRVGNVEYDYKTQIKGDLIINDGNFYYELIDKTLDEVKSEQINKFKPIAAKELFETDWKIQRHLEQVANGIETSLTNFEYQNLLKDRQVIRDKSNIKEQQIDNALSVENIFEVTWED